MDKELSNSGTKDELLTAFSVLSKSHEFKPGDIVRWKAGMKNRTKPSYGSPMVITSNHTPALREHDKDTGSPYYNEPLDVSCGYMDIDGDFVEYYYDSRRLEPYED